MADTVSSKSTNNTGESVRNIFWAYTSFFSTKVLNLVSVVILAWYLDPADFGLMAICLALMGYFEIISQFGMGAALITAQDKVEQTATAVLVFGLAFSTVTLAAIWFTAEPIARWYGDPRLATLLPTIGLALLITALTTVNSSFLYRELRLKAKLLPDIARGLAKGLVAIALAVMGYGIWSLLIGHLAGAAVGALVTWVVRPWLPSIWPDRHTFIYIFKFGSHLIGAQTINTTPRLLDNLLVGKVLGMASLGIYSLAFRIPELAIRTFSNVAGSVIHPVMSKIRVDETALRVYYYGALKYCALLMLGVGAAIMVLAEPLVHVLYAPKWYGMIVPMQFLAIAFALGTINMVPGNLFKALGRTDLMLRVALINLPFFVIMIWFAVPYGINSVAFIQLLLGIIRFIPNFLILRSKLNISGRETLRALLPGVVCALVATAAGSVALHFVDGSDLVRLFVAAAALTFSYLAAVRIVAPEALLETSRQVLRRLNRT